MALVHYNLAMRTGDRGVVNFEIVSEAPTHQIDAGPELNFPGGGGARIDYEPGHNRLLLL